MDYNIKQKEVIYKMILDEIKKGENKKIEFKETLPSNQAIAKTVIAFSNTSGGKLIIGVNKKGEIVGIKEDDILQLEEKITSIIYDYCYPNILPEIYTVNIDGKLVLVIEVFRGSLLPYYLKSKGKLKGTYIRVGSTNRLADEMMVAELQRQRLGKSFDEEENFEVILDELNLEIIFDEFKKIGKKCDFKKLKNLKLIKTRNNKEFPTNALCIALGEFDNTAIKCARFKGTTKEIFIDKKEFDKDLFSNLRNTMQFLQNHLHLSAEIKGLQREEEYELPLVALREALLNAIVHRDYTKNSDIKVAIYDDFVEITSPGSLPNGLTVEEAMSGRSELRNKVLANLFRELKYIESWGSGIAKIKNLCGKRNIEFEINETGNFVSVIFYRSLNNLSKKVPNIAEYRRIPPNIAELSLDEQNIIKFVYDYNKITSKDVAKLLGLKERQSREILNKMVKKGYLIKVGRTRGSYYMLKERN